jgi:hypothetical protein
MNLLLRATELKCYMLLTFPYDILQLLQAKDFNPGFLAAKLKLISHLFLFERGAKSKEVIIL